METYELENFIKLRDKLDETAMRNEIQTYGLNKCIKENYSLFLGFTGFGKSYCIKQLVHRFTTKFPNDVVHVVAVSENLYEEFTELLSEYVNVEVFIINTYVKDIRTCKLLIFDECHKGLNKKSTNFSRVLDRNFNEFERAIGFTAELNEEQIKFADKLGFKVQFKITKEEGQLLGLLPNHGIYNLGVSLNELEKVKYAESYLIFTNIMREFQTVSKNPFGVLMACCQKLNSFYKVNETSYLVAEIVAMMSFRLNISTDEVRERAFQWKAAMTTMSTVTRNAENKVKAVIKILNLNDDITIAFLGSQKQANEIKTKVKSSKAYHASVKNADEVLEDFEAGKFSKLLTVKKLDLGYDNKNINQALNVVFTNDMIQIVQRIGRVIRFNKDNPNKFARFVNFYCYPFEFEISSEEVIVINPSDFTKLRKLTKNMPVKYVKLDEYLDELRNK